MAKHQEEKIYRISSGRIILIYLVAFLIFEAIFFLSFQSGVDKSFWKLNSSFYYYTPALAVATFIFIYVSITQTFYTMDGTKLYHNKMGKVTDYLWSNIIYIDEEFSVQKKMMLFYTKDGIEHLLVFDKEGEIYKTALEKCPLISKEEFKARFPNKKM